VIDTDDVELGMSWDWWLFSTHVLALTMRHTLVSETSSELGEGGDIPPAASVMNSGSSITILRQMDVLQEEIFDQ
jgi:hypothetical protein